MIPALTSLVSKELQQHRSLLLFAAGFSLLVTALLIWIYQLGGGLSYLTVTSIFANPVLVVIALVIGQRMIAGEYYGQTQRFIECLPIRHGLVHWVKFGVGFVVLLVILMLVWAALVIMAKGREPVSVQFMMLMVLRMCAFVYFLWSVVFVFSLLGRWRVPLVAGTAFIVLMINSYTQFEMNRFGPFALMDPDLFSFERSSAPVRHLIETLTLGSVVLGFGMWMAGSRDGSLMETLATPVTTRAKGFLIAIGVTALGVFSYFGPEPEPEPFNFTSPYIVADGNVEIAYVFPEYESDAIRLLQYVVERSQAFDEQMPSVSSAAKIYISLDLSSEPTTYQTEMVDAEQGIVVSGNFESSPQWDDAFFGAYVFHHIVASRNEGRLYLEPYHWLLDGFARWWASYGDRLDGRIEGDVDLIMLEALHITRNTDIREELLRDWDTTSEVFGESGGMTIAYSAFRVLQEQQGTDVALAFAIGEFSRPTHDDVRDWWNDWLDPLPARFERATGMSLETFVDTWQRRMNELRMAPNYRAALETIATGDLLIEANIGDDGVRSLNYSLNLDRPLPADTKCVALHTRLPSYDIQVGRTMYRESEFYWVAPDDFNDATSMNHILAGQYGQGTRVFAALECQYPEFAAPLYLGSVRLTMP